MDERESIGERADALTFQRLTPDQWRMWKTIMRDTPQWFVLRKAPGRYERWRAVAGPFEAPDLAQESLAQLLLLGRRHELRRHVRFQIASLSETMRIFRNNVPLLVEDLVAHDADVPASISPNADQVAPL